MNQPLSSTPGLTSLLRVFLVEDSAAVRELLIENLSDIPGLLFTGFADTEVGGFRQLQQDRHDVVIFDIELKQGNGISLLRSLAATDVLQETQKIIFSNNVSMAYRRAGQQYGVQYFFDKTSELPQLRNLLQRLARAVAHE